jgi:hypothetical protein
MPRLGEFWRNTDGVLRSAVRNSHCTESSAVGCVANDVDGKCPCGSYEFYYCVEEVAAPAAAGPNFEHVDQ